MNDSKIPTRYDTSNVIGRAMVFAHLCSFMRFPLDAEKQDEFITCLIGKAFEAVKSELFQEQNAAIDLPLIFELGKAAATFDTISNESLRQVRLVGSKGAPAILSGALAVNILMLALLAWAQGKRTGLTAIHKAIAGKDDRGGSVRTLQKVWRDYGTVAHFWAAFLATRGMVPVDQEGLLGYLSLVESLRRWATAYLKLADQNRPFFIWRELDESKRKRSIEVARCLQRIDVRHAYGR